MKWLGHLLFQANVELNEGEGPSAVFFEVVPMLSGHLRDAPDVAKLPVPLLLLLHRGGGLLLGKQLFLNAVPRQLEGVGLLNGAVLFLVRVQGFEDLPDRLLYDILVGLILVFDFPALFDAGHLLNVDKDLFHCLSVLIKSRRVVNLLNLSFAIESEA